MTESDSYSLSLFSSSSLFMQTDSVDAGDTSPSNHRVLYFSSNKFLPKFCGKDGIVSELSAPCHMLRTNVGCEIFFCTFEEMVVNSHRHFFCFLLKHCQFCLACTLLRKYSAALCQLW